MKIQLKRSNVLQSGAAKEPTASQLEYGELAINYSNSDPAIFLKDSNNNIIRISGVGNIADDGLTNVPAGTTPPTNPTPESGNLWYNSDEGRLYIYYVDANTSQWVDASPDSWDPTVMPVTTNPAAQTGTLDDRYVMENGDTMTGNLVMNNANIIFEGSTADDFETTLTVSNPTADRTLTLPNISGTLVSTGDSETVTGTMISNNTISNTNINSNAAIAGTKINPNFGAQDITTTGTTTTGTINVNTVYDSSHVKILTGSSPGSERFRVGDAGQIGLNGQNYGTAGQVITSNGSNNAPTWETIDSQTLAGVAASNYVRSDQGDSLTGTYTITSTSTDTPALKIVYTEFDEGLIIRRNAQLNPAIVFENTSAQQGILHVENGVLKWRSGTGSVDGIIYTSADGVALTSGATFTGTVQINGGNDLRVGDGASNERILIQKADNNVSDHIIFYNGTSRVGEIGCEDTTYLRINQETDKPIYTPRYIRADGGFFVDGTTKGINSSGNFVGGTIAGASDYSTLLRSNTADTMTGLLTLNHAGDEMLRLQDSASGNPYMTWYQSGTRRAYIQYIDNGDKFFIHNDTADTGIELDGGTSGLRWKIGSTAYTVWHSGNDGSSSGLDADTLDGYHASTTRDSANTIPIRNSSGYLNLGWINTTSGSTSNTITKVYATYSNDDYIRYCTPNHLANAMTNVVKVNGDQITGTLYRGSSTTPGEGNTTVGWALGNGTLHTSNSTTPVLFNVNANTVLVSLRRSGTQRGRINVTTTRAYFYTTSDHRLKENVSLMTDGIERVKRLKPSYFRWIESQESDEGFIAHELAEVCPNAVDGEKDAVDDEGNIKEQAAEYSYVTPLLTAAIKELIQKVETLEQQVATLTGA